MLLKILRTIALLAKCVLLLVSLVIMIWAIVDYRKYPKNDAGAFTIVAFALTFLALLCPMINAQYKRLREAR